MAERSQVWRSTRSKRPTRAEAGGSPAASCSPRPEASSLAGSLAGSAGIRLRARAPRPSPRAAAPSASASRAAARRTSSTASRSRRSPTRRASPPGWETLLSYDRNYKLGTDALAEEATQDNAKQWTIRLKSGIEFNNGKTLGADDVIYSLRRIADPKNKLFGSAGIAAVDLNGLKKMDKLHRPHEAEDGGLDDRRAARPVLQRHRARRLLAHQQAQVGRHRPVHHEELLARPAERARPQPELLAHGPAVLRPASR